MTYQIFNIQADNLRQILEQTKEPAAETLKAASAYETIASEINEAKEAADDATTAADKLASMVNLIYLFEVVDVFQYIKLTKCKHAFLRKHTSFLDGWHQRKGRSV